MRTYTFELIVKEGSDEFWEEIESTGVTGCEALMKTIKEALNNYGFYTDKEDKNSLVLTDYQNK